MTKKNRFGKNPGSKSQDFFIGQTLEIKIDRLSYGGGRGVGRVKDFVFFVPFSCPGDHLKVKVVETKKTFGEACILEILQPSAQRKSPPCPHAGLCGGCQWQHINYEEQLKQKHEILSHAMRPLLANQDISVPNVIPSPNEFRYRNRIQLQKIGNLLGYFQRGTNDLVPIDDCLLAEADIIDFIHQQRKAGLPSIRKIEFAKSMDGSLTMRPVGQSSQQLLFSQINTEQNKVLQSLVIAWALEEHKKTAFKHILDLFCGSGNFSLPLAEAFPAESVVGVELSPTSVEQGKSRSSASNLKYYAQDVDQFLEQNPIQPHSLVVVDPPRKGLSGFLKNQLLGSTASSLIYVSCDLSTFVRDLADLQPHFQIETIQPIDMFPQTDYLECVARLSPL